MANLSRTFDHNSLDEMVFHLDSEYETVEDLKNAAWYAVSRTLSKSERAKQISELKAMFRCSNCKHAELKSRIRDKIEECRTRNMPLLPQLYLALMITSFDNVAVMLAAFGEHEVIASSLCANETFERYVSNASQETIKGWFSHFIPTMVNLNLLTLLNPNITGLYSKVPIEPDELLIEAIETIEDSKIQTKVKRFFNLQEDKAA